MAALLFDEGDIAALDTNLLEEAFGRLHHGPGYRRVLVPGEEVDVVVLEVVKRVDVAGCGQLLRALDRGGRIRLAPVGLHAAVERLCRVLGHGGRPEREGLGRSAFGAGERAARDDAGAHNVARMGDLELHRHEGAG
jgi:hypothetical protein